MISFPAAPISRVIPETAAIGISEDRWLLRVPEKWTDAVCVRYVPEPEAVTCAATGDAISYTYAQGILTLQGADITRDPTSNDIVLLWPENRWKEAIMTFVEADEQMPPMADGILFTGSSTARLWPVAAAFPDMTTVNRGFGGSQFWDVFQFADRILGVHKPDVIVLYSGDNDIASGKSPEWTFADCVATVQRLHLLAPTSHIVILGIKGSGSRWELYPAMQAANALMAAYAETQDNVSYLDLGALLLDEQGKPDPACYLADALHLSDEGYRRWNQALAAHLRGYATERVTN